MVVCVCALECTLSDIFTCMCVCLCVAAAQSKANQMDRIMTMIRLYRVTLLNEGHSG